MKHKLSIILLLALFASVAHAGNSKAPGYYYPGFEDSITDSAAYGGKPINLLSGTESFSRTDLSIGSIYPITLSRRYNSRAGYDSPLGYGWAHNYDKRLYTYPDGSVTMRLETGWKKRFTSSGSGFTSPVGETGTLVQNTDGTFTFTEKSGEKENFDEKGRLASAVDTKGNSLLFTYQALTRDPLWGLLPANIDQTTATIVAYDYRLSKIEEKDATGALTGKWIEFHYYILTGRLTDIQDSTGRTITYTQDNIGNLTSVTTPSGTAVYGYTDTNNKHRMTSVDEGNGAYVNTYDTSSKVTRQTHGTGIIDFEYTIPYKKTKMTTTIKDGLANTLNTQTRTTEFDTNGQVIKVTDTFGNVTSYTRDSSMWITREEYWENTGTVQTPVLVLRNAINFTYDSKGNTLTRTDAAGFTGQKTTTYTYHPTFSTVLTETVKSLVNQAQNRVTTNTYNETTGNLINTTETGLLGDGTSFTYTTTYTYDANGRITSIDGPRTEVQDVTTYTYDPNTGFLTAVTQPITGTTAYSNHDSLGNPQTITDPNGNSTIYTYDTAGRVLTVKAPGDTNPTQYVYTTGGCQSCGGSANRIDYITLPEGNVIDYSYDTNGNLSTIKDSLNNTINYSYDSEGNKLTEQIKDSNNILQKTLTYQYDALNRLSRIYNPDASYTLYTYDYAGNRNNMKDPKGNVTIYTYDALSRLSTTIQPGTITTSYGYNTNNNLTLVIDPNGNGTWYTYDDKGRVYQVISPDTGTTTYTYDPAGNMTSKTDANGTTIAYLYDALNRLTKIDFPTDTDIIYAYDNCLNGKGRLCTMTDQSGVTAYEYTPKGQVKKETKTIDSVQYITQYTYDQNGNMATMTYPSGRVITYNYTNDRAVSVLNGAANLATNITYKPFGGMSSLTYGNGIAGAITYDNQYRVTAITAGSVLNLSYSSYDINGNITGITNNLDNTKNKTFTYDTLDRLSTAASTGIWGSLAWTYDGVGNRQTENSTAYSYVTGSNKLSTVGGTSYSFDYNGNTTAEGTKGYTYNQNQRLIQVINGATSAGYVYNGNGQRVKKVVNGTTTVFHYNLAGQIVAESDGTGATTAEYVWLDGAPLAKIEGINTYYYHNDHLGTPQKMTDSTGTVVWAADYKPFGEATIDQTVTTITNNLRFPGQYFDAETGLHYNYMRDYNPVLGSYIQADPIGIQEGFNHLYIYGAANPINLIDALGLSGDTYQADPCKHGGPHIDRYDSGGKNIGRYRADGTGIPHKGKIPPSIPKADLSKFAKAVKMLGKCCTVIGIVISSLVDVAEAEAPTLDTPALPKCEKCHQ